MVLTRVAPVRVPVRDRETRALHGARAGPAPVLATVEPPDAVSAGRPAAGGGVAAVTTRFGVGFSVTATGVVVRPTLSSSNCFSKTALVTSAMTKTWKLPATP